MSKNYLEEDYDTFEKIKHKKKKKKKQENNIKKIKREKQRERDWS